MLAVPAIGASYCENLTALQERSIPLPDLYISEPVTAGFHAVRQVAEAVSVGLELDHGHIAWGDCVAAVDGSKLSHDSIFHAEAGLATIQLAVASKLQGRALTSFRELASEIDALTEPVQITQKEGEDQITGEQRLHSAIRYGVSQAILRAVALVRGITMAEVIAEEWNLPQPEAPIPIHAKSIHDHYHDADKMIVCHVASLPDTLLDNTPEQLGEDGKLLVQYTRWLSERIEQLGGSDYIPTIHLNLHGALGQICRNDLGRVLGQLYALEQAAQPYPLRIECPMIMENRQAQIEAVKTLCKYTRFRKMKVQLVADDWANTLDDIIAFIEARATDMIRVKTPHLGSLHNSIEAVLACKANSVGAFLDGSCAESDLSTYVLIHVALATRPDIIMSKPGVGVEEGIMLTQNEMARTLVSIKH